MKRSLAFAALFVVGASAQAQTLVAYWNFNDLSTNSTGLPSNANQTSYAPTSGAGSLLLTGWTFRGGTSSPHGISNFAGSSINAISPDPAGQALALQAGTNTGTPNNGASLLLKFSTTNLWDVQLSFATQRSGTGFTNNQLAYSTDGLAYTNIGSAYNPSTSFALQSFDLSAISDIENKADVWLRITFNGATASAGNNRLDNIQINANPVPEPATMAVLAIAGALAAARRRKKA